MENVNAKINPPALKIRKFRILLTDFSTMGGELTPTLKVQRSRVAEKYEKEIEELYIDPRL